MWQINNFFKKSTWKLFLSSYLPRIVIYNIGLIIMSFGIVLSINASLGVSPVSVLPYVISNITGLQLGKMIFVLYCLYIIIQIALERKKLSWIILLQICFAYIQSTFTDFAKQLCGGFVFAANLGYMGQLITLFVSICCIALGISLYVDTRLVLMPMDGMISAFSQTFPRIKFHDMKIIVDCSCVVLAAVLSLAFTHSIMGIREGTVITAFLVGKVMGLFQKKLEPALIRVLHVTGTNTISK